MLTPGAMGDLVTIAFVATSGALVVVTLAAVALIASGRTVPRRLADILAALGGSVLGFGFLITSAPLELLIVAMVVVAGAVAWWRVGRLSEAGWHITGAVTPWFATWGFYLTAYVMGRNAFELGEIVRGLGAGAVAMFVGSWLTVTARQQADLQRIGLHWGPGARTLGAMTIAIESQAGRWTTPVRMIAAFTAMALVQVAGDVVLRALAAPFLLEVTLLPVLGGLVGAETYLRAYPRRFRRAFEAFSWLGDEEIARFREESGTNVPLTRSAAETWLEEHPDRPKVRWMRAEVLAIANRLDEALEAAQGIPTATPLEAVERLATIGLIRWLRGEDDELDALTQAAEALEPGSDDRLKAEVMIANAQVRRRMSDGRTTPGDAVQPLLDVRERLGARADGQFGRALRKRLVPGFVVLGFLVGGLLLIVDPSRVPGLS